ncbi:MAG: glycine cleavage system aminomethyltransferase GcvT, partial [Actinomycetes bacterium]
MTNLRRSPLHDRHVALGAKMADFGGWEMPIEYPGGGVVKEHTAVREAVGVFDVSHLGKADVRGPGAAAFVNATLANDLGRIGPGKAQYTLCCDDESGGVVDDLIAYYRSDDEVFLIPNAANTAEVVRRLQAAAPDGVQVRDLHESFGVLAVQGPKADDVLEALGLPTGRSGLDYMAFTEATWDGRAVVVCRTGYTGERGYELVPRWSDAAELWDAILAAGEPSGIRP